MYFIWFLIRLVLADFFALITMSIRTFIAALPLFLASKLENRTSQFVYKSTMYLCSIPMLIFMLLFWGFWAAYCVGITYQFASVSTVTFKWVYWVISFISCITLLSWLAFKEKQNIAVEYSDKHYYANDKIDQLELLVTQIKEEKNVDRSTFLWQIYTFIIYAIFVLYPPLMVIIYGPALRFLRVIQ